MPPRRGFVKYPQFDPSFDPERPPEDAPLEDIEGSPPHVVRAGIAEFRRLIRLHWGAFGNSKSFSIDNDRHLWIALDSAYKKMREADEQ